MQDADRAYILRQRWRAGLHDLNGEADAAAEKRQEADVLERYHAARDAALELKATVDEDTYYTSDEKVIYDRRREELRDFRIRQRTARDMVRRPGRATIAVLDNFEEPSDEELLAGEA